MEMDTEAPEVAAAGKRRAFLERYFGALDPVTVLRLVLAEGIVRKMWNGSTDFAENTLVRDPRTVRRWLDSRPEKRIDIPALVIKWLVTAAADMGIDPYAPLPVDSPDPHPEKCAHRATGDARLPLEGPCDCEFGAAVFGWER